MAGPALDSRLAEIMERLEHSGFAAELWDSQWRRDAGGVAVTPITP